MAPGAAVAELHLLDLDAPAVRERALAGLAPDERARAARLAEPAARRRAVGRAALRRILGERLGREPAALRLSTGPWGRPVLADPPCRLAFSLARSGRWALVALAPVETLGVDLERVRPLAEPAVLAADLAPPAERAALALLPPAARARALLRLWVREEAVRKAAGTGLLGRTAMPLWHTRPAGYAVRELEPGPGLVGALATREPLADIRLSSESAPAGAG